MSFFEIFNPGVRHWQAERDRQKMLVSKPTHGGGAPLGIDLDGGFAKITVTRPQPASDPTEATPDADTADLASAARESSTGEASTADEG